ncbi:hypothetical protein LP420_26740 [Massilia sp. B-10]|nr:hypothetical protein LP420_26740 [Massilia sp. B-10]
MPLPVPARCSRKPSRPRRHTPASGSAVIERLPRRADPAQQELRALRAQLAARPGDLALATSVARQHIATARRETDPRYFGYAQAALAPWWSQLTLPPSAVRLLRATLLQSTHHFPEAMRDLDAVVVAEPDNPQAWLTRATVQTVRGDYDAATASCARLSRIAAQLISTTCIASIGAMTGRAAASESLLDTTLGRNADADPEQQVWSLTLLAEIAERRGEAALAEARYRRALALSPRDSYLLGAFADFLLDQRRGAEVAAMLKDQTRIDGLLLRYALALQQMPASADAGARRRRIAGPLPGRHAARRHRPPARTSPLHELHVRRDHKERWRWHAKTGPCKRNRPICASCSKRRHRRATRPPPPPCWTGSPATRWKTWPCSASRPS